MFEDVFTNEKLEALLHNDFSVLRCALKFYIENNYYWVDIGLESFQRKILTFCPYIKRKKI